MELPYELCEHSQCPFVAAEISMRDGKAVAGTDRLALSEVASPRLLYPGTLS